MARDPQPVPAPASLTLFGLGALGLAFGRRRLRRPNP
ncbi:MAG: PEP-CTERM sorting domain-containing protein [Planctomycetaceae bacterium]|nr:PEP-CTERM sorting domain-containing protein [Planctomycetaceae bacterium]